MNVFEITFGVFLVVVVVYIACTVLRAHRYYCRWCPCGTRMNHTRVSIVGKRGEPLVADRWHCPRCGREITGEPYEDPGIILH